MWLRRKEEEKKEKMGKYFLLRNPKPHRDIVISRKQLVKGGGTGLCQTKQTADTARESNESRIYCSNNVAADNGYSAVR